MTTTIPVIVKTVTPASLSWLLADAEDLGLAVVMLRWKVLVLEHDECSQIVVDAMTYDSVCVMPMISERLMPPKSEV